jgi:hypothetical protein
MTRRGAVCPSAALEVRLLAERIDLGARFQMDVLVATLGVGDSVAVDRTMI